MGMSIGGATATEVSKSDRRVKAAINIDGMQFGSRNRRPLTVPFMMLYSDDGVGNNEFLMLRRKNDYHEYHFQGARHADFSDLSLVWPILRVYGQLGEIPAVRMIDLQNDLILNFWDHYLKQRPLRSMKGHPELEATVLVD